MSPKMRTKYECHFVKGEPPVGTPGTEYETHILYHDVDTLQESYSLVLAFLQQKIDEGWTLLFGRYHASELLEVSESADVEIV